MINSIQENCHKINECTANLHGVGNGLTNAEYSRLEAELDAISSKMIELKSVYWYQKL